MTKPSAIGYAEKVFEGHQLSLKGLDRNVKVLGIVTLRMKWEKFDGSCTSIGACLAARRMSRVLLTTG